MFSEHQLDLLAEQLVERQELDKRVNANVEATVQEAIDGGDLEEMKKTLKQMMGYQDVAGYHSFRLRYAIMKLEEPEVLLDGRP